MWMMDDFGYLLLGLLALAVPVLGVVAFFIVLAQRRRLAELARRLDGVILKLRRLGEQFDDLVSAHKDLTEGAAARSGATVEEPEVPEVPETATIEPVLPIMQRHEVVSEAPDAATAAAEEPVAPPAPARAAARIGLEERITSRWFVWVGALALALAGLFLVKYAIDFGLLTPRMRIAAGFVFGLALMAAGEWLRQRPLARAIAAVRPDYVPGALVSAGLFAAYTAIYAGFALFDFILPLVAFLALAAISLLGFLLGALHAPIVAIIGLIGAVATPALVESEAPSALALFGYLAVVVAAATALAAYRGWTWLVAASAAGGIGWLVVWISYKPSVDLFVVCAFAGFLAAATLWFALRRLGGEGEGLWSGMATSPAELVASATAVAVAMILARAVIAAGELTAGGVVLGIQMVAAYALARRFSRFDGLAAVAGLAPFLALAGWPQWEMLDEARAALAGTTASLPYAGLIAPPLQPWLTLIAVLTLVAVVAGYAAARGAVRPQVFAAASVITAAALLAAGYVPLREVTPDLLWAGIAAGLALMALGAAASWNNRRTRHDDRLTLGIYAVATVAALAAVLAFTLRDAWLTVGLALIVPALAWIGGKLELAEFRFVALVVATALLVRLAFNAAILDYHQAAFLGRHWVIYGYGVPAAALYGASRLFARQGDDRLVQVLDGGALAFALMLVSLEIRILVHGSIAAADLTLFEASLHSAVWLTGAWWRGRAALAGRRLIDRGAALALAGLAIACVVLVQIFALNPLVSDDPVGRWPLVNTLALAYLLPALLVVAMLWQFARFIPVWLQRTGAGLTLLLTLLWLTLEVRRAYHVEGLGFWHFTGDAESWTVSAVWIITAFALFGAGIWARAAFVRYGGLAILVVSVLKVFLLDMAGLEGLYRVASFLGLGLSLVAIGLIYQHFMQRADASSDPS